MRCVMRQFWAEMQQSDTNHKTGGKSQNPTLNPVKPMPLRLNQINAQRIDKERKNSKQKDVNHVVGGIGSRQKSPFNPQ